MSETPHVFVFPPLEESQVPADLYGRGPKRWETLAHVVARHVYRASSGRATVVLRPDEEPKLAIAGWFSQAEAAHIRTAISWFVNALSRLRLVDYAQVESDCIRLGEALQDRLSDQFLEDASFVGIPRGGTAVLGLLSYVLGLDHSQISPPIDSAGPLVVVDDCFLSGARLGRFLDEHLSPSNVFATGLYAHPDLRAAVEREHPRIQACVTAQDLTDHAPAIYGDDYKAWKTRWENRETAPRYWTGISEHLCFPWNEPDYGFWNTETDQIEQAWTVVPPDRCLDTQLRSPANSWDFVQVQHSVPSAIGVRPGVFYATFRNRILIGKHKSDECLDLNGTAANFWTALVTRESVSDAQAALRQKYDIGLERLTSDLRTFVDALVDRQILVEESLNAFVS